MVTERQMMQGLEAFFKVRQEPTIPRWFEQADHYANNLPFSWAIVRPVFERVAVVKQVLYPTGKSIIVEQLLEGPDDVLLVQDAFVNGRDGLWFVRFLHDRSELIRWCHLQRRCCLMTGQSSRGDVLLAAPVHTFV